MRLKTSEIKAFRTQLLKQQQGICPLCLREIHPGEATLDHDHGTGRVRRVLHRNCNQIEGRIKQWASRSGIPAKEFLLSLVKYLEQDYTLNPLHPHGTSDQRRKVKSLRARLKKAKRERTKQRLQDEIRKVFNE